MLLAQIPSGPPPAHATTHNPGGTDEVTTAAPLANIGPDTANAVGSASSLARSDHSHKAVLPAQHVTATGSITTTSATFVLATGMTITPAAGTYLGIFRGSAYHANTGAGLFVEAALFAGGVQDDESIIRLGDSANFDTPFAAVAVIAVNGSQAIEGRWRRTAGAGTATMTGTRTLQLVRVG